MTYKSILLGGLVIMSLAAFLSKKLGRTKNAPTNLPASIYDFKMKSLTGAEVDFASFKGKKLLLVNTASKCGKTPQYADLQRLHELHGDKIIILGFPANNFLWQEPGSNQDIAEFCELNYGVKFQMFEKISVKGNDQHPLYQWLQAKTGEKPDWNFSKYLVSEDGTRVTFFNSNQKVLEPGVLSQILK